MFAIELERLAKKMDPRVPQCFPFCPAKADHALVRWI